MNTICVIGNITGDLELKNGPSTSYTRFTIAVRRKIQKDKTDFIPCVAFGKLAELACEFVHKGDRVGLHGSLCIDKRDTESGMKTYTYINVQDIDFSRRSDSGAAKDDSGRRTPQSTDDDFPF